MGLNVGFLWENFNAMLILHQIKPDMSVMDSTSFMIQWFIQEVTVVRTH